MRNRSGELVIAKDFGLTVIVSALVVLNYLPVLYVLPTLLLNMVKLAFLALFLVDVLMCDFRLFCKFLIVLLLSVPINLLAYYHCWMNYTTLASFMIQCTFCWMYLELGVYLAKCASRECRQTVWNLLCILLLITSITTILTLRGNAEAVRGLGNGSAGIKGLEKKLYLRNTATWGMVYGMVFCLPALIGVFKRDRRRRTLLLIAIVELCIVLSQITVAILMSVFILLFLFIRISSIKRICVILVLLAVLLLVFSSQIADFLLWIANKLLETNHTTLTTRVYQLYLIFSNKQFDADITIRASLYSKSIGAFLESPLIGVKLRPTASKILIGMHSQILDLMATTGLLGITVFGISFAWLARKFYQFVSDKDLQLLSSISVFMLVALMVLNPIYYSSCICLTAFGAIALADVDYAAQET